MNKEQLNEYSLLMAKFYKYKGKHHDYVTMNGGNINDDVVKLYTDKTQMYAKKINDFKNQHGGRIENEIKEVPSQDISGGIIIPKQKFEDSNKITEEKLEDAKKKMEDIMAKLQNLKKNKNEQNIEHGKFTELSQEYGVLQENYKKLEENNKNFEQQLSEINNKLEQIGKEIENLQ